jgi:hypothetical protein
MFSQFWHFLLGRRAKNDGLTHEDMSRMDIAYEESLTAFDCEGVMVEEGEVVAETAIINDQNELEVTDLQWLPAGRSPQE